MNYPFTRRLPAAWRLPMLSLALAAFPISAYAQVNAEQVTNIGRNVLSMDDYMLSIHYFNQAIKAKPYLADPYFFRAVAKLSLDDYKGAEEDCSLAIERNKFKMEAYKVRGFARQCMGLDSLAVEDYDIGLEYNPLDKYFLYYKAVAQTEMKQFEKSDSTFSTLLRQYPRFEEGFAARGRLNLAKGDTVAAISDLDQAIHLSKSLINPYLLKAEIAWKRKDWKDAGENIDAAIRLRPDVADLYVNRAFIRYNSDDFFGAMSDYNYALELEPDNTSALFNRALLRYEVKDLARAEEDLTGVLKLDPTNFHALYNRGLIRLEAGKYAGANSDFLAIARKYPKFHPVYYALAETRRQQGDMRQAMQYAHQADELVKRYVKNPEKNPLDRPAIAAAESKDARSGGATGSSDESETEVMEKFNRLVTVSNAVETQLSYNEKIKGRVQDRNVQAEPEPMFTLSFNPGSLTLRSVSNYFRELDDLNRQHYINRQIYLNPLASSPLGEEEAALLFEYADQLEQRGKEGKARPVDLLALGIARSVLKNYPAAIEWLDEAIKADPNFTVAYMARAYARYASSTSSRVAEAASPSDENDLMSHRAQYAALQSVIGDYDKALQQNPRLVFASYNKGNIYYSLGDYPSALQCFSDAIKTDPEFGEAYFNRGLTYLRSGNKSAAFSDLSKAGELGILPSYNILKRMK